MSKLFISYKLMEEKGLSKKKKVNEQSGHKQIKQCEAKVWRNFLLIKALSSAFAE